MVKTRIVTAQSVSDIEKCYPVMHQLRPHLELDKFISQVNAQQASAGYTLVYLEIEGQAVSALGFRVTHFLAWGQVLYIDDLVTDSEQTNRGYAGKLLDWAFTKAKELGCDQVHLDSGFQRHAAHKLYLNKSMLLACHHFSKVV